MIATGTHVIVYLVIFSIETSRSFNKEDVIYTRIRERHWLLNQTQYLR